MLQVDLTHDVDKALTGVMSFFRDQVSFVTSQALNDTAFDVRRRIVGSTWPKSITQRNKAFAGRNFKVTTRATKVDLEAIVAETLDLNYVDRLAEGGDKLPRGNWLAVPVDVPRGAGGAVVRRFKPMMLKNSFVRASKTRPGVRVILQRQGKTTVVRYILIKRAHIDPQFRFYEDATDTAVRVFSGHWGSRMAAVVRASVFD